MNEVMTAEDPVLSVSPRGGPRQNVNNSLEFQDKADILHRSTLFSLFLETDSYRIEDAPRLSHKAAVRAFLEKPLVPRISESQKRRGRRGRRGAFNSRPSSATHSC